VLLQALNLGLINSESFAAAQHEIYMLMERDNFARFKRSDLFKNLLQEIDPYRVGVMPLTRLICCYLQALFC
jgi:hypothetical protein